jgi:phage tail sheath protein FI
MPASLATGIYIEEVRSLLHPINCESTGTAGSIGVAVGGFYPLASGINPLRFFSMQGSMIWGARTSSQDSQWQYVNIRRLVLFIERSLGQQLQWAVFENNGPGLWARVVSSVESFLTSQWQSGSLHGSKRQDAFFVKCGNTTMTQNDIDNGRLVIIVGFAPVRPAEFVVLQISGQTGKKK